MNDSDNRTATGIDMSCSIAANNTRAYFEGFLDVSGGNLFFNNDSVESRCHFFFNNCDISLNGNSYETGDISMNIQLYHNKEAVKPTSSPCDPISLPPVKPSAMNPFRWFFGRSSLE